MRYSRKVLLAAATIAAGLPLAVSGGSASSAPSPTSVSTYAVPEAAAEAAAEYWTPARMAAAKPLDMTGPVAGAAAPESAAEAVGSPGSIPGIAVGGGGTGLSSAATEAAISVPRPYTNNPDKTVGKVFFTIPGQGNFVCSGTAVNSTNKSLVWTAGHCVENGTAGGYHTNWVFVPAYSSSFNGQRPYGTWTARFLNTLNGWALNGDLRYDQGAVVVNRLAGQRLVDRIGGQGLAWNQNATKFRNAFGYPQAFPFNGFTQWRCNGTNTRDVFMPALDRPLKLNNCNLTGGSSGGPWLINLPASGLGYVNGVNSYKYNNNPNAMYSPYFGVGTLNLLNAMGAIPV